MANEIVVTASMRVRKDSFEHNFTPTALSVTLTNLPASMGVQAIGTVAETVAVSSDVTTAGWSYLRNLHSANYVDVSTETSSFTPLIRLKAGEFALYRAATTTLAARAQTSGSTAVVNLQYAVLSD
jgi:hypothetical protein